MADDVKKRLPDRLYPLKIVKVINQYLFEDLQFTGNTQEYYDPRNSYLNDVIGLPHGYSAHSLDYLFRDCQRDSIFPW
jgi:regulator of sirC expression with transglutaminase-like and TPR domain